jgi:hypothetical protein
MGSSRGGNAPQCGWWTGAGCGYQLTGRQYRRVGCTVTTALPGVTWGRKQLRPNPISSTSSVEGVLSACFVPCSVQYQEVLYRVNAGRLPYIADPSRRSAGGAASGGEEWVDVSGSRVWGDCQQCGPSCSHPAPLLPLRGSTYRPLSDESLQLADGLGGARKVGVVGISRSLDKQ